MNAAGVQGAEANAEVELCQELNCGADGLSARSGENTGDPAL